MPLAWFRIRWGHALTALVLFLVEAAIAIWLHDPIIRPYAGDSLAVVLVYAALRAGTSLGVRRAALIATLVAFAIEVSQYFHLVYLLGLGGSRVARAVLGTGFDFKDFGAYLLGTTAILIVEAVRRRRSRHP
ncbi:DUF2809 domain-containing protein [uncultured Sphingomonas sp.]|uniref:ribosomal maturation YjgA family protein n=1 Tax=uncultured Sphingomonas sp. TaxID=158754 RepID=UPI0025E41077|nr:DUF2809 domain-containing protein [uncultured Sphingomonas sp.]